MLRKHINQKSQTRLVERLNREFTEMARLRRFATAVMATYLTSTDELTVSNAGHPRPLHFRAADGSWSILAQEAGGPARLANLPLGLDDETRYGTSRVKLGRGDLVVFYTDALTEAADGSGQLLGESGLLGGRAPARPRLVLPARDRPVAARVGRSPSRRQAPRR